ncbi:hypothetical protein JTB14_003957 [Gonioctena quinquepunctata]|nr:hypothetical protein JTB14_003957 [Gonioctena quinquepunctata]
MKNFFVLVVCLVCRTNCFDYLDGEVETECVQNCPLQNRTDNGHYGYACDQNCNTDQGNVNIGRPKR